MTNDFIKAFNDVLEEKQLPKEVILEAIESAMASAYRRAVNASSAQEVVAKLDPQTGDVTIFAEKEIVEDVQDERTETTLDEALGVDPEAELGGMALVESTPSNFGRVAAQTARQVIQQRIREAERGVQADYFERQIGEIISGVVQATAGRHGVTIGLDMKAEGTIPNNQKIPGERFRVHDRVRAVILEVKDTPRGPQIILSRGHGSFLRRLLENEVPEIYHGVVEIRGISREPGRRAKVAVSATQEGIDPVGACVGIRGVRIQNIVRELHNEKIDIIEWNPDPVQYISKAISPARVTGVYLSDRPDATRTATVVVQEDQLSLAIGRDGQNARLAAKLTGWRIDIKSLVEATADSLYKLQNDAELSALLTWAVEEAPAIEAILAKKTEGRSLAPEEFQQLAAFMDRVESRTIEVQAEADIAEQERLDEARAAIHPMAFEMMLVDCNLKDHVFNILFEAEYETVGALMLALRLDPDKVFSLPGIGNKAIENITEVLSAIKFPEPEVEAEEVEAEEAAEGAEEADDAVAEGEEAVDEAEQVEAEGETSAEEATEAIVSMSDVFEIQPEMLSEAGSEDELDLEEIAKLKKKQKKKYVKYEFDPELGEVVAKKQRKRKSNEWDEEENW